jgi:fibro-slime domain-containing protein
MGGFYPAEGKKDDDIVVGTPLTAARTKREAEGPVFIGPKLRELDSTENVMKMNVLCNGIGWNKGIDCKGLFADGEDIVEPAADYLGVTADGNFCVWGWSCPNQAPDGWAFFSSGTETYSTPNSGSPRWTSLTGRNQHFCFESHAKFTYKKGQRFGVRGDDDIWIFIGGRLAIDLGGTHMAAPGYADLSRLTDKNDEALVVGKTYDIDIFFCDRRTTMSNMNFFSNIYLDQSESIDQMKPCEVDVEHIFDDDSLNPGRTVVQPSVALPAQMRVAVEGRFASVSGVKPGSELTLMDMQGRVIGRYHASSANVKIEIRNAGRYILKAATGLQVISVR